MAQPAGLRLHALEDPRMAVPNGRREDSAEEVQELPSIDVPDTNALAFIQGQGLIVEGPDRGEQELPLTGEDVLAPGHLSGCLIGHSVVPWWSSDRPRPPHLLVDLRLEPTEVLPEHLRQLGG